jgi:hypothetical protein
MIKLLNVEADFTFAEGAHATFGDLLELSLDCFICKRTHRTVGIRKGMEESICTPTQHPFPAKILEKTISIVGKVASILYRVEYWYSPFVDLKRNNNSSSLPQWGRLYLDLTCPRCNTESKAGTQTNIVRPRTFICSCGCPLYTETEISPIVSEVER